MTKQTIYDTIVALTSEINATNIGTKIFEAANSGEAAGKKVKEVSELFMSEYYELYQKMCNFADDFNSFIAASVTKCDGEIFGTQKREEQGIVVFDPNIINASSFFVLTFLTDIDDSYLFTGECLEIEDDEWIYDNLSYLDALEEESGSFELAIFLANGSFSDEELEWLADCQIIYNNIYDLLADVFAGKLPEYVA